MPRAAPPNCECHVEVPLGVTKQSQHGDGNRPICRKCSVKNRECIRRAQSTRYVIASPVSNIDAVFDRAGAGNENTLPQELPARPDLAVQGSCPTDELVDVHEALAARAPVVSLQNSDIAKLFDHYVAALASWYDLNDTARTFTLAVPNTALHAPLLFKAIIAFSACHWSKVYGEHGEIATAFHDACVTDFLQSMEAMNADLRDSNLAATCLLRSYELISGSLDTDNHLLGAYSYASSNPIDFSTSGILQTGAWNYLREEITVALIQRRAVRMGHIFDIYRQSSYRSVFPSDQISYLLAQTINFCFAGVRERDSLQERRLQWQSLRADVNRWHKSLPLRFAPFSFAVRANNPFPSIWMLHPHHIAAHQYRAVAEILLTLYDPSPEGGHLSHRSLASVEIQALRVCGSVWTNVNEAARVNAFGPMAFCGRYLRNQEHRDALERLLRECSLPTGWPVEGIIRNLQEYWATD